LETNEAYESLGVDIAPYGNQENQIKHMMQQAQKWSDQIQTGRLHQHEVHLALHSTIFKHLEYPLSTLSLTKEEFRLVQQPIYQVALLTMRICRTFPHVLHYAHFSRGDLQLPDLYVKQGIAQLESLFRHLGAQETSLSATLLRNSLQLFILESGLGEQVFQTSYTHFKKLVTPCLLTNGSYPGVLAEFCQGLN